MRKAYKAAKIFTGNQWLYNHVIIVEEEHISEIRSDVDSEDVIDEGENFIIPGYVDLQIYGANDQLLADNPHVASLETLSQHCLKNGTIAFQPTLATNDISIFHQAFEAVRDYRKKHKDGLIGLHLEGPWINKKQKGAHIENFIRRPDANEVRELLEEGRDVISMITLAPEECSDEVFAVLRNHDVVVSAGHSHVPMAQALKAFDNGVAAVTHLFNAMSGWHHREPGLAAAALMHERVRASVIPDGHHVSFQTVALAKKIMGERLFAITDAVTGSEGVYKHKLEGEKYVSEGVLSGSALTMHKAFVNLVEACGIEIEEAVRMCSAYPAQVAGLKAYGKIAPGTKGQFLVISKQLELLKVISP